MTIIYKSHWLKHLLNASHKPLQKRTVKVATSPPRVFPAEMVELPLVNLPYQIFVPVWELIATPWRMLFPFNPWKIVAMERTKARKQKTKEK